MEKKELIKNQAKLVGVLLLIVTALFLPIYYTIEKLRESPGKQPVLSYGIIMETDTLAIGSNMIRYKYKIEGVTYEGNTICSKWEKISIGDTCEIIYASKHPELSSVLKLEDGSLNIRSK